MSHIKLVAIEHHKRETLEAETVRIDRLARKALGIRVEQIKQQFSLNQYGRGNYLQSLMLHDPQYRKILTSLRRQEHKSSGQRRFHVETPLEEQNNHY